MATRVFVVEDNLMNLELIRDILEVHGYTVETAGDGRTALGLIVAHPPDLILMDIQIPEIDGFALAGMLRANAATARVPMVAITAHAMRGDDEKILAGGFDGYIAKPFDTRDLPKLVARYLGREGA
jgi:two-component system cell cycle response regulator DivK